MGLGKSRFWRAVGPRFSHSSSVQTHLAQEPGQYLGQRKGCSGGAAQTGWSHLGWRPREELTGRQSLREMRGFSWTPPPTPGRVGPGSSGSWMEGSGVPPLGEDPECLSAA